MSDEEEARGRERPKSGDGEPTAILPEAVPHGVTSGVPGSKVYPLNSSRIATGVIKRIAAQLELPGTGSLDDTLGMVENRIRELGHEPS